MNLVTLKRWGLPLWLLALALAVRLPGLGGFVTFDEPRWLDRSRWFLIGLLFPQQECPPVAWGREVAAHGLACTLQIGYPGVTTMWAGSLGLLVYYWQTARLTGLDLLTFLQTLPLSRLDPALIPPARLPLAVAGALFVLLFYLLLRRLWAEPVAWLAALIFALQPYPIALSRVLHHDALTAAFMGLSALALTGYWLRGWRRSWLIGSGILAGLALLSKQVSWFMPPFVAALAAWTLLYRRQQTLTTSRRVSSSPPVLSWLWRLMGEGIIWGLAAGLTFVVLFPAMWLIPGQVLQTIFNASTGLAEEGHTHLFLGQVSADPGPLFYPVGWLLRATPFEVIGLLAAGAAATGLARRRRLRQWLFEHPVETALLLFVGWLWLFVSLSNKKMVRYYLPAIPLIDVFAALGWLWLLDRLAGRWSWLHRQGVLWLGMLILVGQGWLALIHYPYYLTYHNPLFGGLPGAARLMTIVGWGEALNEAADYLNRQPGAESLQVVAEQFCSMLQPFAVSRVSCLNSSVGGILRADYMVYYYNLVQRNLQWPEQWTYFQRHAAPVHRVTLHGLDYVLIYRNPIRQQVDREANSLPGALTAFGYNLSPTGHMTLFWQNLGLGDRPLLVGLAPTPGVYPVDAPAAAHAPRQWIVCSPASGFAGELDRSQAIIESVCPLDRAELPAGLYDLQLAVNSGTNRLPLESSLLAVVVVDAGGQFEPVRLVEAAKMANSTP
ncbi:MAG: glycosyltransferase family 39 protein [Chloroflexota bacterium]